jgi:hypothetical protein
MTEEVAVHEPPQTDPTDIVAMAKALETGVPLSTAAVQAVSLEPHTWTPDTACPMRSYNRKVGSLVSLYDLQHADNTIVAPPSVSNVAWLARCETHAADFYSRTISPAWQSRNRPWQFCPECAALYASRYGEGLTKPRRTGTKTKTIAVAPPAPPAPPKPKKSTAAPAVIEAVPPAPEEIPDPVEEATWDTWAGTLAKQAPAGSSIEWVDPYHYEIILPDQRVIELRVHKGDAIYRWRDAAGRAHYHDDFQQLLAEIG